MAAATALNIACYRRTSLDLIRIPPSGVDAMDRLSAYSLLAILILAGSARADDASGDVLRAEDPPGAGHRLPAVPWRQEDQSGLKVDSRESLLKGGDRGPAIVAGEPEKSLLDPGDPPDTR